MKNVQPLPALRQDWKLLLLFGAAVYILNVILRMTAYPGWQGLPLEFSGEHIQSTPDAYFWLAGAKGFGAGSTAPLAYLARFLAWITGAQLGNIGFWAPVFVSSLAAVATLLWCWALGCLEAGLLAGTVAGLAPGYVGRTHLGFYDSDMVTLLFPLCISLGCYLWMRRNLSPCWPLPVKLRKRFQACEQDSDSLSVELPRGYLLWPYLLGVCACFFGLWHERVANFNECLIFSALILALIVGKKGTRPLLVLGIILYALPVTLPGWWGLGAGFVLLLALCRFEVLRRLLLSRLWQTLLLLVIVLVACSLQEKPTLFWWIRFYLQRYLQPFAPAWAASGQPLAFPSVSQSVAEASKVGLEYLDFFSLWGWPALCAVPGFLLALLRYPGLLFLAPLAALGMGGSILGVRMAMFGAPAFGIGLGVPLFWVCSWLLRKVKWRGLLVAVTESLCAVALIWPCFFAYAELPPKAVFSPYFCQALDLMQHASPPNAVAWTMWEWGYGVNYYAERQAFADGGGRRSSGLIYPLSLAYYADSPVFLHNLLAAFSDIHSPLGNGSQWNVMSRAEVDELMRKLHDPAAEFPLAAPQFFVVSLKTLDFLENIASTATWDFTSRKGRKIDLRYVLGNILLKQKQGIVSLGPDSPDTPVDSIDIFLPSGLKHLTYENNSGLHVLVNPMTQETYLLHTRTYQSMAVQLLVANPRDPEINKYFELVYDRTPWVRVFKTR